MGIPTAKQIADKKRSAKARSVNAANREAKRILEGRKPDNTATRAARKAANELHIVAGKRIRTEAQKQIRTANDKVTQLLRKVKELQIIDSEHLLDLVIPDDRDNKTQPVDLIQVLDLRLQGCTLVYIAETVGCTIGRLRGLLKRYDLVAKKVQSFKDHRADIFADLQRRILKSITDADLARTPVGSRLLALCHLYEKERLERDLTTANVVTLHDDIATIKKSMSRKLKPAGKAVTLVEPARLMAPDQAAAVKS